MCAGVTYALNYTWNLELTISLFANLYCASAIITFKFLTRCATYASVT